MPASVHRYYTVEEVLAFPSDGNKYELVYGELVVSPTPRMWHQRVVVRLSHVLHGYCHREKCGEVFNVGCDLTWGRRDVMWTPDAQFPVIEHVRLTWHPDGASQPLVIELTALFAKP